mgnify:CR=1 FL=1
MKKGHVVETATEARQGERGPTARNMVVAGTALVIAAFVVVYIVYFGGARCWDADFFSGSSACRSP